MARLLLLLGAALAFALEARAQEPTREQLIAEAQAAADRNDHETARQLALSAAQQHETPSLRLFIAQEEALSGRTAEAIASARRCIADSGAAARNRQAILSTCRSLERQLLRRVALVTVRVPAARDDLAVSVNGQPLPADRWGQAIPVPPGEVIIEASAAQASMRQILRIDAGDESAIELSFEGGELRASEHRDTADAPAPASGEASSISSISPLWLAVPGGAAVVFGLSAIGTGAAVLDRGGAYDALVDACAAGDGASCRQAPGLRSEGEALRDATNVLWVSAALAAAAAAVLCLFVDWNAGETLLARQRGEPWAALYF